MKATQFPQSLRTADPEPLIWLPLRVRWDTVSYDPFPPCHFLHDIDTTDHGIVGDIRERDGRFDVIYPFAHAFETLDAAKQAVEDFYRRRPHWKPRFGYA